MDIDCLPERLHQLGWRVSDVALAECRTRIVYRIDRTDDSMSVVVSREDLEDLVGGTADVFQIVARRR